MGDAAAPAGDEVVTPASMYSKEKLIATVAPGRTEAEVDEIRNNVMAAYTAQKAEVFSIPAAVRLKWVCTVCGNIDQATFIYNNAGGDVVCLGADAAGCGNVVEDHHRFEGSQYRKFEGEEDKSHHGPAPNRLYSAAHNMRTTMVATGGRAGPQASRLRQAYDSVELGLSNLGSDERRTRVGYKDRMKKRAFDVIVHASMNLGMHPTVVDRAQELFATFRDEKEYVQRFNGVVAACLIQAAEEVADQDFTPVAPPPAPAKDDPDAPPPLKSKRAALLEAPRRDKRARADGAAQPKIRAGKDWAAQLGEL
ncbi:hypothetical protein M885DRAFT_522675 [Pelagophyceae sp. CCMP2097]|nr:hypothetical protein M885DRAFT_522675 [Pelagophyceae sp. CCMP2097]|mmetsp:Transcript_19432/g.65663  ORF Transcript_19432/g.65663 Transcript_19432/m.65663 type:complete len:309 (+) Transcript_19432:43-969(+)